MEDYPLSGRRAQIIAHTFDPRFIGLTGELAVTEDGYVLRLDRPMPDCCQDYEDSRQGELVYGEDIDGLLIIDAIVPNHQGQVDGDNPIVPGFAQAIADLLGPEVTGVTWADETGQVTQTLNLATLRPEPTRPEPTQPEPPRATPEAGTTEIAVGPEPVFIAGPTLDAPEPVADPETGRQRLAQILNTEIDPAAYQWLLAHQARFGFGNDD